jgi:hypothetical protein
MRHFNYTSSNASATFERFVERVFDGMLNDTAFVYIDDVKIASENWSDHFRDLREALCVYAKSA